MGGSLVVFLILFILDIVVCSPKISQHRLKRSRDTNQEHSQLLDIGYLASLEDPAVTRVVSDYYDLSGETEKQKTFNNDENRSAQSLSGRPLREGDTFTPQDMLPIAKRLLKKVDKPGEGKGIVSSQTHPQVLADVLYEAYFRTFKRIITLKPHDISGLKALHALSISGNTVKVDVDDSRGLPSTPNYSDNQDGETDHSKKPEQCTDKVLTKQDDDTDPLGHKHHQLKFRAANQFRYKLSGRHGRRRRRFSIREHADKKLGKNRKLVIKSPRRSKNENLRKKKHVISSTKTQNEKREKRNRNFKPRKTMSAPKKNKEGKICRWRYKCTDPSDQKTCQVSPDCVSDKNDKYIGNKHEENDAKIKTFRRMIGIESVDEEVEKILERQTLILQAKERDAKKIETLGEYFDKLMKKESNIGGRSTTPMPKKRKKT